MHYYAANIESFYTTHSYGTSNLLGEASMFTRPKSEHLCCSEIQCAVSPALQ